MTAVQNELPPRPELLKDARNFSSPAIVLIRMPGLQIRRIPRAPRIVPA